MQGLQSLEGLKEKSKAQGPRPKAQGTKAPRHQLEGTKASRHHET